jgi:O-succinylbenzoate synthase
VTGELGRPGWANARVFVIRLRRRFRGLDLREGVLVSGPGGWGEFSPFWDYDRAASIRWLRAAREAAYDVWPAPVRSHVPVNATVPVVPAGEVGEILARFPGCRTAKVKVADGGRTDPQTVAADLERLAAVRAALGAGGRVRIDLNGAWSLDDALRLLPRYDRAAGGLEYAEQPCADVDDLARLRRRLDVPVAADESIRRSDDPLRVVRREAADVAVLKVAPTGGVRAALRLAEQLGLPVVVSSALETSVGMAAGLALAAALPELPYACGLGTVGLLTADVTDTPLVPVDGRIEVRRVAPSPAALDAVAADAERTAAWRARVSDVHDRALPSDESPPGTPDDLCR